MDTNSLKMILIDTIEFSSAEDMVSALSRHNKLWSPNPIDWIFRGHSNDSWKLIPRTLRDDTYLGYNHSTRKGIKHNNGEQIEAEFNLVMGFLSIADYNNVPIPNSHIFHSGTMKSILDKKLIEIEDGKETWPIEEWIPWIALAQHSGVATRLLDWTRIGKYAAFFAARGAARKMYEEKSKVDIKDKLGIWAINLRSVKKLISRSSGKLIIHTVSTKDNLNLWAQKGLFTLLKPKSLVMAKDVWRTPTDEFIVQLVSEASTYADLKPKRNLPIMRHLTLPIDEASSLLMKLGLDFIDSASLFPGLNGIAKAIEERRWWKG